MPLPTPSTDLSYILLYGYPALFAIIAFSEVTAFVPVGIVLIGVGALARAHYVSFFVSLAVASAASTLTDYVVFSISRKLGRKESYRRFVGRYRFAGRLEGYVSRYPEATIFLSRLVGFISTPVNAIAGLSQMSRLTFAVFDLLGNALCTVAYLAAGYFIGAAWQENAKITSIGIGVALVIGVLGYFLAAYLRSRRNSS